MTAFRVGTFIKTASPHIVEVLGTTGLDFGILDQEHGPFDRSTLDVMLLAGRAAKLPLFVRIGDMSPANILGALDLGAAGLFVPHVDTPAQAAQVVSHAKFLGGQRGFSNAGRWGNYGSVGIGEALELGDRAEIFCMIESPQAVENAAAIAATPGVAGLMIGRADLSLSMGLVNPFDAQVAQATSRAIAAARASGKSAAIVTQALEEGPGFLQQGVDMFIVQSDQTFIRTAAGSVMKRARAMATPVEVSP